MHGKWHFERRFIVSYIPGSLLQAASVDRITRGYLSCAEEKQIYVQDTNGQPTLSVVQGSGLKRQTEVIALLAEQFSTLWGQTQGLRFAGEKSQIKHAGQPVELMSYTGNLAPLKLVVVTFANEQQCREFIQPDYVHTEVTHHKDYTDMALARIGLPDINAMLGQEKAYG